MRYNSEDKYYSERDASKKHDATKRRKRPRSMKPKTSGAKFITAEAIITSDPKNECSIFQNEVRKQQTEKDFRELNREEVTVTATLFAGAVRGTYVLRFVHKNCIQESRRLLKGERIRINEGYFNFRPGRKLSEFWVRSFELIEDHNAETSISSDILAASNAAETSDSHQQTETVIDKLRKDASKKAAGRTSKPFQVPDSWHDSEETQAIATLHGLNQMGFGLRFTQEILVTSQPRFLQFDDSSALVSLRNRIHASQDTFGKLREIARYIFSDGYRYHNTNWRQQFKNGQWTNPAENPGLVADSWLATLTPEYRLAVARSLLPIVYRRVSDPTTKFFDELTQEAIENETTQGQIEIALSEAGIKFLQLTELPGHQWRFPLSVETLTELCLFPLELPKHFWTSLPERIRLCDEQSKLHLTKSALGPLDQLDHKLYSRTLWALSSIMNDGHCTLDDAKKKVSSLYGIQF